MRYKLKGIDKDLMKLLEEKCGIERIKFLEDKINKFMQSSKNYEIVNIPCIDDSPDILVPLQKEETPESEKDLKEIIEKRETTLKKVYDKYQELLYIEDTDRIDVVLAVALSRKLEGIPIWMIIIGASGDMKSVQLNALIDDRDTYILHNLTSKTLVNGYKNKKEHPDLAPKLDGKLVIIPDMAQILKLPPVEKAELWGQLRDLYDGFAGKESGQGSSAKYSNLKITLLAGSTPSIDAQILVHQDLGTRELLYRTKGSKNKEKVMERCFKNEETEAEIKNQLKEITQKFLGNKEIKRTEIKKEILDALKGIAMYTSFMRSTAEFDGYTNELRNWVYPEEPTRIAKQLKRLYICLKSLDEDYPDEKALRILWHIAQSSSFPVRTSIFNFLMKNKGAEYSTSQIAEKLDIGKGTAKRECLVLQNIGMVHCRWQETNYPDKYYYYWKFIDKPSGDIIQYVINVINTYIIYSDGFNPSKNIIDVSNDDKVEVKKI